MIKEGDVVTDWKKAQNITIYEQLKIGARFFDLRPGSPTNKPGDIWIYHQVKCGPIRKVLNEFKNFIAENPDEIIYIKHEINDSHLTQKQTERLIKMEERYLGKDKIVKGWEMIPDGITNPADEQWFSFKTTTVGDMRAKGKNFIIFYEKKLLQRPNVSIENPYFDSQTYLYDRFLNKNHPSELLLALQNYLQDKTNKPEQYTNQLYVSQAILTPPGGIRDFIDWSYGLGTPSLSVKAAGLNVYNMFEIFVDNLVTEYSFNCLMMDWIHYHNTVIRYLISSNFRKVLTIQKAFYQGGEEIDIRVLQNLVSYPYNLKDWADENQQTRKMKASEEISRRRIIANEDRILSSDGSIPKSALQSTAAKQSFKVLQKKTDSLNNIKEIPKVEGFGNILFFADWDAFFPNKPNNNISIIYSYDNAPSEEAKFNLNKDEVFIGYYKKIPPKEEKRDIEDDEQEPE